MRSLFVALLLTTLLACSTTVTPYALQVEDEAMEAQGRSSDIRISEILVSASSEDYNGT
ncbi:MAG: hypothetical protein ISR20_05470, partial [Candidatus Poseidonia sp.]|nr:hypothetical protein [Poseidonia sp.]